MAQSLAKVYLHLVFSTKGRVPFLKERDVQLRLHAYLAGASGNLDSPSVTVGGVEDHVHMLCRFGRNLAIADLIRELKRQSSRWIKEEHPRLHDFQWQQGYGAFSISPSHVGALSTYIAEQEEHHRHKSFQEEFRTLCAKYGVELDERYVWD
ncbi:Transposase IS200 like protein [Planctomycetes bacterium Pan216]|uniref:Transposase IS200 like protein n=1 Tax=Kolteria novifilia TaxID=2527975 RepID=A0A518AX88_9BACT|nr:Transposase IS200 like protein [Planctomycetes bacterium Pan216]